jgi:hypothetical protein
VKQEACVLVVSDLHCGSIYGMLPPGFQTSDGKTLGQNPGQAYLWKCWQFLCDRVAKLPVAAVVVNGDVIDGRQQAQRGTELALPMIEDQSAAAEAALAHLKAALGSRPKFYFTQGTEYHDAKAGREVEVVARALSATPYSGLGTGRYCREVLDLEIDGVVCNFAHGISVSGGLYRATSPDREAVWSALAGKEGKMPRADALVRSHAHYFVHVEHQTKHAVICPAWQLQTRFMRKNSVYRMIPDIGAILLWIDGEAKRRREDGVFVEKILFDLPKIGTTKL